MSFRARVWHALRHDIGRKLTALGLAFGVWSVLEGAVLDELSEMLEIKTVHSVEEADRDRLTATRSTVYLVVPDDLQMQKVVPESLRLRVKGLKEDVRGLVMSAALTFDEQDLGGQDTAAVTRELSREHFRGRDRSPELTLFRIGNDAVASLTVTLVRRTQVELALGPVNVHVAGTPAAGYVFDGTRVLLRPNLVTVSGPRPLIEAFKADPRLLKLAPVSVEHRNQPVMQYVDLAQDLLDKGVSLSERSVEVTVPITPMDKDVRLFALPIIYKNLDALAELGFVLVGELPRFRDVLVKGPAPELEPFEGDSERLARQIDLSFDFRHALLDAGMNNPMVDYKLSSELSRAVKVYGVDRQSERPRIDFKLEKVPKGP